MNGKSSSRSPVEFGGRLIPLVSPAQASTIQIIPPTIEVVPVCFLSFGGAAGALYGFSAIPRFYPPAALTIARMPARMAGGNNSQLVYKAAISGGIAGGFGQICFGLCFACFETLRFPWENRKGSDPVGVTGWLVVVPPGSAGIAVPIHLWHAGALRPGVPASEYLPEPGSE